MAMASMGEDPASGELVEECVECGDGFLEIYIEDGVCPDCRDA